MLAYLKLMRPLNSLMSSVAVFIGGLIVLNLGVVSQTDIYLAMIVAFLLTGAGNGINDWVDVEADKVNKPKRPIPSGKISRRAALGFSLALFLIGILLSGFVNTLAFFIAIFNSVLLIIYPLALQDRILIGNIAVSYLVGSTFLFGGVAVSATVDDFAPTFMLLMLAFFANLAREIVKDMEDIEGDRKSMLKKIEKSVKDKVSRMGRLDLSKAEPSIRHKKALIGIAQASLLLAVAVSPFPYFLRIFGYAYLFFLFFADVLFLLAFLLLAFSLKREGITEKIRRVLFGKRIYRTVSKFIKFGMLLGLLAFVVGTLL